MKRVNRLKQLCLNYYRVVVDDQLQIVSFRPMTSSECIASIHRMKTLLRGLGALVTSLEEALCDFQAQALPTIFHEGIDSLPSELLARIFEMTCEQGKTAHIQISQVCKRFRDIAVNHAPLWTYISSKLSVKWVQLHLERSRGCGLTIDYSFCRDYVFTPNLSSSGCPSCIQFLNTVIEHKERWTSVRFDLWHALVSPVPRGPNIYALNELHLPALRRLDVSADNVDQLDIAQVLSSWRMPLLQRLVCGYHTLDLVPNLIHPLKSLRFSYTGMSFVSTYRGLVDALSHPNLQSIDELTIVRDELQELSTNLLVKPPTQAILSSLRTLSIDFSSSMCSDDFVQLINVLLEISPNLEVYSISFNRIYVDPRNYILDFMVSLGEAFLPVSIPLKRLFRRNPRLREVVLDLEGHMVEEEGALTLAFESRLRSAWSGDVEFGEFTVADTLSLNPPSIRYDFKPRTAEEE